MPPKKKIKILTSGEVLKDVQKFSDEEDNENISDEDVHLDELYCVKSIFASFYQYIVTLHSDNC